MDKPKVIRQPYSITLAEHDYNINQQRFLVRLIESLQGHLVYGKTRSEVAKNLFGNLVVQIRTKSLLPEGSQNYSAVKRDIEGLRTKTIKIQGEDKKGKYDLYTGLIQRWKYYHNNEFIEVELDKAIAPSFIALAKNYSKYQVEVAFNVSSTYIMRLYQYISHWSDKATIEVKIDDLRRWLRIENKYKKSKDIRTKILEPAAKELKAKADIYFEIEKKPLKNGRPIVGWKLRIFRKIVGDKELLQARALETNIRGFLKQHFKFSDEDLQAFQVYLEKPELHRHIWDAIKRVGERMDKSSKPIKNKRAYMRATLSNELEGLELAVL